MSDRSGLKIADLITRFTYYPSLTIERAVPDQLQVRPRLQSARGLVLPDCIFENFDGQPPAGLARNDYA